MPPVKPMLAKPQPKIPTGKLYEPKWDGFRSIIFRDGDDVEIGSRNERPMTRYFPEVVDAVKANFPERAVIDGEIVVLDRERNCLEFEVLQQRIHPAASRVNLLAVETPASFVAFDLLARGRRGPHRDGRSASAGPGSRRRWPRRGRRCTSRRSPTTTPSRRSGSTSSRAPGWTGSSPRTRRAPTSPTSA